MSEPEPPKSRQLHGQTLHSEVHRQLMDGPKSLSQLPDRDYYGGQPGMDGVTIRDLLCKLIPPRGSNHNMTVSHPPAERVLFLVGDDRQAIRTFTEVNGEYLRSVFSGEGSNNIIAQNWTDAHYSILCHEWQYRQRFSSVPVDEPEPPKSRRLHGQTLHSNLYRELMDGPKPASELSDGGRFTAAPGGKGTTLRDLVCELTPNRGRGSGGSKSYPSADRVVFLVGDDRQAIRRFLEVNDDYLRAVFSPSSGGDVLCETWTDVHYSMLCHEWQYRQAFGGGADA